LKAFNESLKTYHEPLQPFSEALMVAFAIKVGIRAQLMAFSDLLKGKNGLM